MADYQPEDLAAHCKSPPATNWPLSQDELKSARAVALESTSFLQVALQYALKIEETQSTAFTHRCTCPNNRHKNGQERTPSFYFSEHEKRFMCFGCSISGDVFDFIALMDGLPWYEALRDFLKNNNVVLDSVAINSAIAHNFKAFAYNLFETNLKISSELREHLKAHRDQPSYNDERVWVEMMFKKLDSHLNSLTVDGGESLVEIRMQIEMEMARRQLRFGLNTQGNV